MINFSQLLSDNWFISLNEKKNEISLLRPLELKPIQKHKKLNKIKVLEVTIFSYSNFNRFKKPK